MIPIFIVILYQHRILHSVGGFIKDRELLLILLNINTLLGYNIQDKTTITLFKEILNMGIGWQEILLILVIVFLIFGAKKLPELGKGLGEGIKNFKEAVSGEKNKETNQSKDNGNDKISKDN
jgi:sec-independent protein translocase protein TatA